MGRNKGSKTGIIKTVPAICKNCGTTFQVLGKHRQDGPKPAIYCNASCYHASKRGTKPSWFIGKGGAPKGRVPWNKGKSCPQLAGENNGMHGRTHTPEVRAILSQHTSSQLSVLTRQRQAAATPPLQRSDPLYPQLFRVGWRPLRKKALERDGHICRACNGNERLTVHHVIPFGIILKHELDNLITLCRSCHNKVHRGTLML